ncbi:beta-N-acetylhexosaminidase [Segetibacter sp. 3557_3]|uniref:glycoside hydrolase family 20 protein n=1 Tax=Segetibacter sp. 3557_3 TaxID=2547429 RepID=UPI0010588E18|nr:family 20 glycosylhydrolase [Segetibacter sp. 3557_3]TDH28517.1 beta-N-acetylhexosaminidase [Segetibacter sp. 3557_3]
MIRSLLLASCLLLINISFGRQIIPAPVKQVAGKGTFKLSAKTQLVYTDEGEKQTADFFNDYLSTYYGFKLPVGRQAASDYIRLTSLKFVAAPANEGHYTLEVTPAGVNIQGDTYKGTFYGMQSLLQLLPVEPSKQLQVAAVNLADQPRFSYRGLHLDVCRHFFPVDYVKKYIDFLALHKMNTFHWHLTDDQGWRIEIKKYPKLTEVGGYRNGTIIGRYPGKGNDSLRYGGFYTQDEIREVVKYAAARFITVIPEIEMPGHASAAIAAYPELSCFPSESTKAPAQTAWSGTTEGKQVQQAWGVFEDVFCPTENTFKFLGDVLDEVVELFPSEYIHIGGDESPKESWKRSAFCQQLIKEKNLKDEHGLQSYFIQRMEKFLNNKGRKIIGWDEILEGGLAPNATVMSWRGEKGGIEAAKQNHTVIMTPSSHVYFDHAQSKQEDSVTIGGFSPIEKVYQYEPLPKELNASEAKYILGAQANLWTEYIKNTRKVEYQLFPRVAALSEVLWSPLEKRNYKDFETRFQQQLRRYDLWKVNYSKAYFEIKDSIAAAPGNKGLLWYLSTNIGGARILAEVLSGDTSANSGSYRDPKKQYAGPLQVSASGTGVAGIELNGRRDYRNITRRFMFNKATGKKITISTPPSSTYPGNVGAVGLVNGLTSDRGFNSPEWLGWQGKNLEAVIDLGETQPVSRVVVNVWKQEPSYIYLPKSVVVYTSSNGTDWSQPSKVAPVNEKWDDERKISIPFKQAVSTRYIRVVAENVGTIGTGKPGAGRPAWLFVDELEVY